MSTSTNLQSLYCAATLPISLIASLALCAHERGRVKLRERFGSWGTLPPQFLWFHGASVGEINGLKPLLASPEILGMGLPRITSVVSTTALEGAQAASDQAHVLPFDNRVWIRRALGTSKPKLFIFGETEIWPELLALLHSRGVPRVLVNGRMTDGAFRRYLRFQAFFRPHFERLNAACVAEERSAEMFAKLGVPVECIEVTGNAKYDLVPQAVDAAMLRSRYFPRSHGIITLGSIRPGEEECWFPAIRSAIERGSACDVVVAPRHREKFEFFAERLATYAIPFQRWSTFSLEHWTDRGPRVLLLDTFGHLLPFYAVSSVAFVGATLVPIGGHNPLEVAMYGVAVAMGPHRSVVQEICDALQTAGGLVGVNSVSDCAQLLERVAHSDPALERAGLAAQSVWSSNRGATQRIVRRIARLPEEGKR